MIRFFVIAMLCVCTTFTGEIQAKNLPSPYDTVWQSGVLNDAHSGNNLPFPQCSGTDDLTVSSAQSLAAGNYAYDALTISNGAALSFDSNNPVFIHVNKLNVLQSSVNHDNAAGQVNPLVIIANEVNIQGSNVDALIYVRKARTGLQSNEYDIQGSNIYGAVTAPESLKVHGNVIHDFRFPSGKIASSIPQGCPNDDSNKPTYFDKFDVVAYDNSDGEKLWSEPWVEARDGNSGPGAGKIAVENGRLKLSDRNQIITRKLDLSAYNTATVSFDYEIDAQINNERVTFDVGTRNNRWKRITRFDRRNASGTYTYVIDSSYIHSNSRFRLRTNGAFDFGNRVDRRDFFYVDNFAVNATTITATYLDLFNASRFDNNDGEKNWSSNWQESEGGNSPTRGHTKIRNGKLEITNKRRSIQRKFDLSTYANAQLEFSLSYQTSSENSDVTISLSKDNGATWDNVYQFNGESSGTGQRTELINIDQFTGEQEVLVRIQTADQFVTRDRFELDYLAIRGSGVRNVVDHYRIIHPSQGLTCQNHQIELKACGNTDCSIETTDDFTATISKQFGSNTDTILTVDTAADANSVRGTFNHYSVDNITFALTNKSIEPQNDTKCYVGSTEQPSCAMSVAASGFVVTTSNFVSAKSGDWNKVTVQALASAVGDPTTCVGAYDGSQTVDIDFNHISAIRAGGDLPLNFSTNISGSSSSNISSTTNAAVDLDFGTTSSTAEFYVNYLDVGELQLVISDSNTNGLSSGSNNFVVYPDRLSLTTVDANNNVLGSAGNLTHMADESFKLSIQALNAQGTVVKNYIPGQLQLQPVLTTPTFNDGAQQFSLTYGSSESISVSNTAENNSWHNAPIANSFNDNGYEFPSATISEVGTFSLNVRDANYYNQVINNAVSSTPLGRMTPAYFSIIPTQVGKVGGHGNNYSYSDYPMPYELNGNPKLTFVAKSLTGATTQNYTGQNFSSTSNAFTTRRYNAYTDNSFANNKLLESCFSGNIQTQFECNLSAGIVTITGNGNTDFDGEFDVDFSGEVFTYLKSTNPTEPVSANIALELVASELRDGDGIGYCSDDTVSTDITNCVGTSGSYEGYLMQFETNFDVRYGRLILENVTGIETEALAVPAFIEYWNNGAWERNVLDSTTTFSNLTGTVTYDDGNKTASPFTIGITTDIDSDVRTQFENGVIAPGYGLFVQPNNGERAQLEMSLNNIPDWLEIDWNSDGVIDNNDNVSSIVIFESFSGNKRIIYKRQR